MTGLKTFTVCGVFLLACNNSEKTTEVKKTDTLNHSEKHGVLIEKLVETETDFPEKDSIQLRMKDYLPAGYMGVNGKPMDSVYSAVNTEIYFWNKKVYSGYGDGFFYYDQLKHYWPRLYKIYGNYVYMFERSLGEPQGSDLFVVTFDRDMELDTFSISWEKARLDAAEQQDDETLVDLYKQHWGTGHDGVQFSDSLSAEALKLMKKTDPECDKFYVKTICGDINKDGLDDVVMEYGKGEEGAMRHVYNEVYFFLNSSKGLKKGIKTEIEFCADIKMIGKGFVFINELEACMASWPETWCFHRFKYNGKNLEKVSTIESPDFKKNDD